MRSIKEIFIHCSATGPDTDIGAAEIRNWHLDRGWRGIGYHWVITRSGEVERGRDLDDDGDVAEHIGAHALGHNEHSLGICLVGGLDRDGNPDANYTRAQWASLEMLVANLTEPNHGVAAGARVRGHRDVSSKACPCFDAGEWWYG